ncbi:transcriptional regulator, TetR family [Pedobacter westerhofensis]|uniref:Transcriptional regulator, TetR family n=1 Tax=Pedobacter westerhofensis TaxID=425512 RepID=A0A521DTC4_9SPHI|nr:TetR/AcrR family transcriptional regulator [Pedobacter westerhofensis]SMO74966.1 transcriptional regulator, TetR family [Pedobacter westerhofensis]
MARNVEFDEELAISRAMDLFWKKGYTGTSMRDLCEVMGVNASSIYNTIGDKHQLFIRCIKYYTESRMEAARKQLKLIDSPFKAIEKFINASAHAITNEPDSCLAIKTTFELAVSDEQVQKILKKDNDFTYSLILDLVTKALEQKEITISQDKEMLTDFIINHFTGWHESFIIHKDEKRIKKMAKFLIEQLSR